MRPRVFPAEDGPSALMGCFPRPASMRPRVFPAEDESDEDSIYHTRHASMRPRVFPAEDLYLCDLKNYLVVLQ